jgi:transcription antitermination factor NusG
MTSHWYALRSKPMKEALLCEQLSLNHVESYYPRIHTQPVNPRARKVKPYFPGYVFGYMDLEKMGQYMRKWIPGLANMVSFDGIPIDVPDNLIAAIRRKVDQINAEGGERLSKLKRGDIVTVQEGPFKGYEAILESCLSGEARVKILLKLLNRPQIRLELPGEQIQGIKQ